MNGKKWDLTSISSLTSAAEWIHKGSDAEIVLIIRKGDTAFAIGELEPMDVIDRLNAEMPRLLQHLINVRARKREKAQGR